MSRVGTGQVLVLERANGRTVFALRYRVPGVGRQYETLHDVRSLEEASDELAARRAAIRAGTWTPPATTQQELTPAPSDEPTFWQFAETWFDGRVQEGLAPKTRVDLEWSLNRHLIWFGHHPLSAITAEEIDRYKVEKARERRELRERLAEWEALEPDKRGPRPERGLSHSSINHTLRHLAAILETAVEYGKLPSNPAAGRRRRLKADPPARPYLEPEQVMAFVEGAPAGTMGRVLLELLTGCGLRISEALGLKWRDVDLGAGALFVRQSKTAAGIREVHLPASVRETLSLWRLDSEHATPDDYVCTKTGRRASESNLRRDVLRPAVQVANETLQRAGIAPIERITFHGLRRTYTSLRHACGDNSRYVARQLGHTDSRFTERVYDQARGRRDRLAKPQRKAYDAAVQWALMGTGDDLDLEALQTEATKSPV